MILISVTKCLSEHQKGVMKRERKALQKKQNRPAFLPKVMKSFPDCLQKNPKRPARVHHYMSGDEWG
jgi:hypothetical protein